MSAIEDVMLRCRACGERVVAKVHHEVMNPPGRFVAPNGYSITALVLVPEGWRASFGASGQGSYVVCPPCKAKDIRIDDTKPGVVGLDHGGFHDD